MLSEFAVVETDSDDLSSDDGSEELVNKKRLEKRCKRERDGGWVGEGGWSDGHLLDWEEGGRERIGSEEVTDKELRLHRMTY